MSPAAHSPPPGLPYAATDDGYAAIAPATSRLRDLESAGVSTKPFSARSTAGITTSFHGSLP